jgi:hypothetical protein
MAMTLLYHRCVRKLMAKEETDGGMEKYGTGGGMRQQDSKDMEEGRGR